MIKVVKKIATFKDKFPLPVDLFELSVPMKSEKLGIEAQYLLGGYYNQHRYPMLAFFASDEQGNILDNRPFILEEGVETYQRLFSLLGYTLI